MDKKLFLESLNSLESAFGEKVSEDRAKIYWDILKNYSEAEIKKASIECILKLKFFPKIAEIIEIIEGNPEDEAESAWLELKEKIFKEGGYESVTFENPVIISVIEALGGWIKVCDTLSDDMKWVKRDFMIYYPIMKKRDDHPKELTGIFEIENNRKGYNEENVKKLNEPEKVGDILEKIKINKGV